MESEYNLTTTTTHNISNFNLTTIDTIFTVATNPNVSGKTEDSDSSENAFNPYFPCGYYAYRNAESNALRGIIGPGIVIPALILNGFVVTIFLRKDQRTPTSVLLVGLAIFDSLFNICTYMCEPYNYSLIPETYATYPACAIYTWLLYTSIMFHFSSVYITTTLGLMRFSVVAFPIKSRPFITIRFSCVVMFCIFVFQFIYILPSYFIFDLFPASDVNCTIVSADTCFMKLLPHSKELTLYNNIMRCIFSQGIPCVVLMFTTTFLVLHLTRNTFAKERHVSSQHQAKKRRTTLMVIAILVIFLIVEIQVTICLGIRFYEDNSGKNVLTHKQYRQFVDLLNFELLLEVSSNFWIYIFMSEAFRTQLLSVLCKCCKGTDIVKPKSGTDTLSAEHRIKSAKAKSYSLTDQSKSNEENEATTSSMKNESENCILSDDL